ncbi:MAG TPA: hypothetical protein DDZ89_16725 [Clostridiales bacterium]|nr:hypothetical protein [Clostridiales bacterium]
MIAIDIIVLGIIAVAGIVGLFSGIIRMTYKVLSFIFSIFIALKFADPFARVLQQAEFYQKMVDRIYQTTQGKVLSAGLSIMDSINHLLDQIPLPENIKPYLAERSAENASAAVSTGADSTAYAVSSGIADYLTVAIAGILLFVVIRILFSFIFLFIKKIADAPVIKQLDRSVGFILGCVAGLLVVFSIFTAITVFATGEKVESLITIINNSTIASYLYHNNPINNLVATKITD